MVAPTGEARGTFLTDAQPADVGLDTTGQHRQRVALPTGTAAGKPLAGTFDWTKLAAEVKVPDGAKRMRVFLGLLPATGQLLLDDVSVKVR
jgi:hypothetical protein